MLHRVHFRSLGIAVMLLAFLGLTQSAFAQLPPAPLEPSNQIEQVPIGGTWSNFDPSAGGTFKIPEDKLQKLTMIENGQPVEYLMWHLGGEYDHRITKNNADPAFWDILMDSYANDKEVHITYDADGKITDVMQF